MGVIKPEKSIKGITHQVRIALPVNIKSVKFIAASIDIFDTKDISIAVLKAGLNNICLDSIIDVIIPFTIASAIIEETGQSIAMKWKYPIVSKSPLQQPNKHHKVFLDACEQVCLQYRSIIKVLCVDTKSFIGKVINLTLRER